MGWERTGPMPTEIKVSFVVKTDEFPELAEWLWRLPFRQASSVVRKVLSEAAIQAAKKGSGPQRKTAEPPASLTSLTEMPSILPGPEAPVLEEAPVPVTPAETSSHQADSDGMTSEVANLIQQMDNQFN